jgi:hypothetical protein
VQKPDIGIIFDQRLSSEDFKSFEDAVKFEGLNLAVESREPSGPMACSEWYILPVVAAFIGKSYFDGFLKEMGKDHYQSFKDNLSTLTNKVMNKPRIEPILMGTEGKISTNNPFSLSFAIHADTDDNFTFKLLVPKLESSCNYDEITTKFMEFLENYHLGLQSLDSIGFVHDSELPVPYLIFVHYCTESKSIKWLNEKYYR